VQHLDVPLLLLSAVLHCQLPLLQLGYVLVPVMIEYRWSFAAVAAADPARRVAALAGNAKG
jgi:hypothetical protein